MSNMYIIFFISLDLFVSQKYCIKRTFKMDNELTLFFNELTLHIKLQKGFYRQMILIIFNKKVVKNLFGLFLILYGNVCLIIFLQKDHLVNHQGHLSFCCLPKSFQLQHQLRFHHHQHQGQILKSFVHSWQNFHQLNHRVDFQYHLGY